MNLQVLKDRRISEAVNIRVSMSDIGNSGEDGLRFKKEMGYHTAVEDGIEILVIMQQKEGDIRHQEAYLLFEKKNQYDRQHLIIEPGDKDAGLKHRHDFYEIIYVIDGVYRSCFAHGERTLHKGEFLIMNRNIIHSEYSPTDVMLLQIHITQKDMDLITEAAALPDQMRRFVSDDEESAKYQNMEYLIFSPAEAGPQDEVEQLLEKLLEEQVMKQPGHVFMTRGLLARMFSIMTDPKQYKASRARVEVAQKRLLFYNLEKYLERNLWEVNPEALEAEFGYTDGYLRKLVRSMTSESLTKYCMEHKLEYAAKLMEETDLSVNQVIERLGYQNKTYFYRIFREKFGKTPTEYRQMHQ